MWPSLETVAHQSDQLFISRISFYIRAHATQTRNPIIFFKGSNFMIPTFSFILFIMLICKHSSYIRVQCLGISTILDLINILSCQKHTIPIFPDLLIILFAKTKKEKNTFNRALTSSAGLWWSLPDWACCLWPLCSWLIHIYCTAVKHSNSFCMILLLSMQTMCCAEGGVSLFA